MKKIFHFFGSIHFAVSLIATTALFVIIGTLLESWSNSHLYAASWTYQHPAFIVLLIFFFVNILFSALRRWPFQTRHIPFLITHLGLLMIIGGVMIKTLYGVQGVMHLVEGSGSHELLLPQTYALRIEDRKQKVIYTPLKKKNSYFQLMGYAPHSEESNEYWIKGNQGVIQGLPPFPVYSWKEGKVPISARAQFTEEETWDLIALHVDDVAEAAQTIYQQSLEKGEATLNFDKDKGFQTPIVRLERVKIPLNGDRALINSAGMDLIHIPTLAFLKEFTGDTYLFFFDSFGRVHHQKFQSNKLPTLAVYDDGFSGYHAISDIPYYGKSRQDVEEVFFEKLTHELSNADHNALAPPLQLLYDQYGTDYARYLTLLFQHWNSPDEADLPPIDWISLDPSILRGIKWAAHFFDNGGSIDQWPLPIEEIEGVSQEMLAIQQTISIGDQLPDVEMKSDGKGLKTFLTAYGITPQTVIPTYEALGIEPRKISIESPLSFRQRSKEPSKQIENNQPIATIQLSGESHTLTYQKAGAGLCLPADHGNVLIRFQPMVTEIPFHVRLRNAQQITYANSQQPFSYEADLLIDEEEVSLSMNKVYETWNGYRFYLSSISPPNETEVKRIQLIVNRDPAKYFLTYPGGILVSLGILLLFWWAPKKKER